MLSDNELDFHTSFRVLSSFKPSHLHPSITEGLDDLMDRFVATTKADKRDEAKKSLLPWLKVYAERVSSEKASWQGEDGDWEEARCREMRRQNPRFVLRQWLLEETIKKLEHGSGLPRRQVLSNIMKVSAVAHLPYVDRIADCLRRWQRHPSNRMGANSYRGPQSYRTLRKRSSDSVVLVTD